MSVGADAIVVDSTEFQHTNPKTAKAEQLFCVLAAWATRRLEGRAAVRRGLKAVREDDVRYVEGPTLGPLLAEAFTSPEAWAAFYDEATSGAYPTAARWARHWNKTKKTQTARRASLPPQYATGAIEPKPATVRQVLERRRWTFRNRRRMNTLLELVRQRLTRTDDVTRWAGLIRADPEGRP